MDIRIENATIKDAAQILALQKSAYQSEAQLYDDWHIPPLTQTLSQIEAEFETRHFLKALHNGTIVGSVRGFVDKGTCAIGRLIVHPGYQRKGIGTRLMQTIETAFPDTARFELFTGSKSTGNINLYQTLGYRVFREERFSPKVHLVFMEKQI